MWMSALFCQIMLLVITLFSLAKLSPGSGSYSSTWEINKEVWNPNKLTVPAEIPRNKNNVNTVREEVKYVNDKMNSSDHDLEISLENILLNHKFDR